MPILGKSYYDLSKFDFSFKDISIYDIQSEKFEAYIEQQQPDFKTGNMSFINSIVEEIHFDYDKKYAIVKNNPKENFNSFDIYNVWKILLIIFPSDLQIEHEIFFQYEDDFFTRSYMSSHHQRYTGEYPGKLLYSRDEQLDEINEFIRKYFQNLDGTNYIEIAIQSYLTSFSASHFHFQYLTLCMALESVIYGSQELTYRLRRSIGLLCGDDLESCRRIYSNINKLYKVRSKIIHGEKYDFLKLSEYLEPLQAIVSRTIIELLVHNISNKEELNSKITELGYGNRSEISENWKKYDLNIMTIVSTNWNELN